MVSSAQARLLLARRSGDPILANMELEQAFAARLGEFAAAEASRFQAMRRRPWEAEAALDEDEVFELPLGKFDQEFQPDVPWSLERVCGELRAQGLSGDGLSSEEVSDGRWGFYAVRHLAGSADVVLVRRVSPTRGLRQATKLFGLMRDSTLTEVSGQLVAVDERADLVVIDDVVLILNPAAALAAFVDADAVKGRAAQAVAEFSRAAGFEVADRGLERLEAYGSRSARFTLRLERLSLTDRLKKLSRARVEAVLDQMDLALDTFGSSGPLEVESDLAARTLLDIAEGRYYRDFVDGEALRADAISKLVATM